MSGIKLFALCTIVIGGLAAAPAAAAHKTVVVTGASSEIVARQVKYRDLNLASLDGERLLANRVHSAVNRVCLEAVGGRLGYMEQIVGCQSQSWQGAEPQIERAVQRARDIAASGWSAIAPVAISIAIR